MFVKNRYDVHEAFGGVNLIKTLKLNGENTIETLAVDRSLNSGQSETFAFTINTSGCTASDLSVTLVWTDPATSQGCNNCVLNNMDLKIDRSGQSTLYPNGGSSPDNKNNVERIRVNNPTNGATYTATVTATNIQTSSQSFSVVASGCFSEASDTVGTEQPSAAPSNAPTVADTDAPTDAPTMIPGNTASPTVPQPSAFPSGAPSSAPTVEPLPSDFCEVTLQFQNLKIVDDQNVGADEWNDDHTELFQRSVHALNTTEIPDYNWVCFISPSIAFDKVNEPDPGLPGLGNRALKALRNVPIVGRLLQEVKYVGIHVDFAVTAPFTKNGNTCNNDNSVFVAWAHGFYNDIATKLGDGTLQGILRSHGDSGASSWLAGVTVELDNILVIVDPDDSSKKFTVDEPVTSEDRFCTNWERKQWLKENKDLIITVGAASFAMCCFCGIVFAWICKKRKNRQPRGTKHAGGRGGAGKKYKANIEMHNHSAKSPFHKSPPKGGGSRAGGSSNAEARMQSIGYHGTKTKNPSKATRGASTTKPPARKANKRGSKTTGGYY